MHITDPPKPLRRLPPKLIPQQRKNPHPCLRRPPTRPLQRQPLHPLRRHHRIHNPIPQRLFARPPVRFQQHLPCHIRTQLEARQGPDAGEVEAEVYGRHGEEAARAVHDAVVVGEGEGAGAAEGVAGEQRDCREGEVEDGREEGVEAVGVGEGVCVALVQLETLRWCGSVCSWWCSRG